MGFWNSRHNWARISARYRNDRVTRDLQRRRAAYYNALNVKIGLCVLTLVAVVVVSIALLTPPETLASIRMSPMVELSEVILR
jgi:hypothetical protein